MKLRDKFGDLRCNLLINITHLTPFEALAFLLKGALLFNLFFARCFYLVAERKLCGPKRDHNLAAKLGEKKKYGSLVDRESSRQKKILAVFRSCEILQNLHCSEL